MLEMDETWSKKTPQEIDWFQFYGLMKGRKNNLINHAASRDNWRKKIPQ
jgi:hypothetical protein